MKANYNKCWIPVLVFFGALVQMPIRAYVFVVNLSGGLHDPGGMRSTVADVVYAPDRDGREVKLLGLDSSLEQGMPLDLGMPSVGPDGTVFFGAHFVATTRCVGKFSRPIRRRTRNREGHFHWD